MEVSGWRNGGSTYGIRVGIPNRQKYFKANWKEIELVIDGNVIKFGLTKGFWNKCPEFRDRGFPYIKNWLAKHKTLDWPKGTPPKMNLIHLQKNVFQLTP